MSRETARRLAREHLERDDAIGWFEALYQQHRGEPREIPWADLKTNPNFEEWLRRGSPLPGPACVVGCGLGDDAYALESLGFTVTAFDVSPTAIAMCRERFPNSKVNWVVADLFALPQSWLGAFPFVLSLNTLQIFRDAPLRQSALDAISSLVAPGGKLLLICRGRSPGDPEGQMPWPLLREELHTASLTVTDFEDYLDNENPPVRRFRVHYSRLS